MATINSGSERQARKDAANLRAATYACGAYLASSRRDLTYDDIYSILRAAGGITPDRKAMYAHLDKWRVNHGYERDERK